MTSEAGDAEKLLTQLRHGDNDALAILLSRHRERLWHMINFRLDQRLLGRVDADDILQEAYLDAAERISHFVNEHSGSFYVWLRLIVLQTMANVHRRHLGAQMRDARREISISAEPAPAHSATLAMQLLGHLTSPSQAAIREETARKLTESIDAMSPIDREVLTLRHFEQLTNSEVAEVLDIGKKAASIRYVRALKRLKEILKDAPGFSEEQRPR